MTEIAPQPPPRLSTPAPIPQAPAPAYKLVKPYFYISTYYGALAVVVALLVVLAPGLLVYAPIGGAASFGGVGESTFEPVNVSASDSTLANGVKLALSTVASFLLMLPVTWICMGARRRKDVTQSFVQTILVLPMVITGIVHVVHNSLALAFSLAGIVAGVRFRHTLKDSAETTYLFTSIAVGVACGINAVEVAAIISIFFNYAVLGLWATEYGGMNTGKQMFSREWMSKTDDAPEEKKEKKRRDDDDDD
ncbi:MAG: DUF4956 domain-containing protein [Hyphomonadaceae bacterium]